MHPTLLLGSILIWYVIEDTEMATLVALLSAHLVLRLCEKLHPRYESWKQTSNEILTIIGITLVGIVLLTLVDGIYEEALSEPLQGFREILGIAIWPEHWPILIQIVLFYFSSEFILYWIHRSIHNYTFLWRLSGHAFHHSFKNLHAINFVTAHPLEIFFLVIPATLLSFLIGVPSETVLGGGLVLVVNASFAHANVKTNSKWLGLFFTNSAHHSLHHSAVFKQSNTNYSCNAIIFDRIFGTYSEGAVEQAGIGATEPGLAEKLMLPVRQPTNITTAPHKE